jgi:hypothetical protein
MGWTAVWVEDNEIACAPPEKFFPGEKIIHLVFLLRTDAELLEWKMDYRALGVPRIEAYDNDNDVIECRGGSTKAKNLVVLGGVDVKVVVITQGTILAADLV